MKLTKTIRAFLGANFLLLFVFAFLPVLAIKPDMALIQSALDYINKD